MRILHITNDFAGSSVYKNLCKAEDKLNISQCIYSAIRDPRLIGRNSFTFENSVSTIIYSNILNFFCRINLFYKTKKIYNDIIEKVDNLSNIDVVHAHTWYSDGATAYKLHKKYNIPYIVTIRNTDMNVFFKYLIFLKKFGLEILLCAKKIIFISEAYKNRFIKEVCNYENQTQLTSKIEVIPNGVDDFWLNTTFKKKSVINNPISLIYIGNFLKGKNIKRLIDAVDLLIDAEYNIKFNIVGGGKNSKLEKYIKSKKYICYHGYVSNKETTTRLLRNSDIFVMPSIHETFGLVYVEALSQGIPILYTKGEGIDGLYNNSVGEAVDAKNIDCIKSGIQRIIDNYSDYNFDPLKIVENHNWANIADKYMDIYSHSLLPDK